MTIRTLNALLLSIAAFAPLFAAGQPGTLDATFGVGGYATSIAPGGYDKVEDLAVQADDRIVVVGRTETAGNADMLLLRYTADGEPDASFGTNGRVTLAMSTDDDGAGAVVVQPDGRIAVAGFTKVGGLSRVALARFMPDGSPDTDFGTNGQTVAVLFSASMTAGASSLLLQPDGKLVVGGTGTYMGQSNFMVARFTTNGVLDTSFDDDGSVFVDVGYDGENDIGTGLGLQADGKIVLSGYSFTGSEYDVSAARFNADGNPDYSSFPGNTGHVRIDLGTTQDQAAEVVMLPDGRMVLVGQTSSQFGLVGISADGFPDPDFGTVLTTLGTGGSYAYAAVLQPWDKVIAAGRCTIVGGVAFALARYNAQGDLDATFGTNGTAVTPVPSYTQAEIYAVGLQSDGRIIAAGRAGPNSQSSDVVVVRYLNDLSTNTADAAAASAGITAYPNPFTDRITVQGTTQGARITLSDALGRAVLRTTATEGRTDHPLPGLPPGAYTLSHSTGAGVHHVRVVKQ